METKMSSDEFSSFLMSNILFTHDSDQSYTEDDIAYYENLYGFKFPEFYRIFLKTIALKVNYFRGGYKLDQMYELYLKIKNNKNYNEIVFNPNFFIYFCDFEGGSELFLVNEKDPKVYSLLDENFLISFECNFSERIIRQVTQMNDFRSKGKVYDDRIYLNEDELPYSLFLNPLN